MTKNLESTATAFTVALSAFERQLEGARARWNDTSRLAFDQRHIDPLLSDGQRSADQLRALTQEVDAAMSLIRGLE